MNPPSRDQVPARSRDGQSKQRLEIRRSERMKVDGLKFTDALQIERCPEILGNVDMQAISIGIEEACNGTRPSGQQILSRSNPCIPSRPLDQFSGCRSNGISSQQDEPDEKPSVQVHPKYREWRQHREESFVVCSSLYPAEHPAEHDGEERCHEVWSREPVYGACRHREAGQGDSDHPVPRFLQCAFVNTDRRSPQEQQAYQNNSGQTGMYMNYRH